MIGFISDRVLTTPFASRMIVGAQHAAAAAGSVLLIVSSEGDQEWRRARSRPDRMAMGASQACHELGLKIPGHVSLVGFDDQERGLACPSGGLCLRLSRLRP